MLTLGVGRFPRHAGVEVPLSVNDVFGAPSALRAVLRLQWLDYHFTAFDDLNVEH